MVEQKWLEQWFFKITDYAEVGVAFSHMTVMCQQTIHVHRSD